MSWLSNIFGKRTQVQQGTGTKFLSNLLSLWGGHGTASGVSVSEDGALKIGAVFTAVRIRGGTIASLPLHVYRRSEEGRQFATKHWAYPLLHDSPNEYHTSYIWREIMSAHLDLWGNHYSRIDWLKNGTARALLPLMPWDVEPYRTKTGEQKYHVQFPGGSERLPADEVIHIPGLGYDGVKGLSVIGYQKEALGLNKAMETFSASFFKNGAKPGAILETPGRMKEEAQKNLATSIMEKFGKVEESFKVLVLEDGAKLHTYTMPLAEAELLNSRKMSRSEIFAMYGVPPHLAGDTERQTSWGTGIEQMDIGYAKHTVTPICVKVEQELNRKLFGRGSGLYVKFSMEGLMRGDFKNRMDGYRVAVGGPFLTRAEVREIEDWNQSSEPGMDKVLTPLNMHAGATPPVSDKKPVDQPAAIQE